MSGHDQENSHRHVGAADASARGTQRRYDFGYQQCMYAKGHRVPVAGKFTASQQQMEYPAPPPGSYPPPPAPPQRQ